MFCFISLFGCENQKNQNTTQYPTEEILLYNQNCSSCHGLNLEGAENWISQKDDNGNNLAPPLDGTGHAWHHSRELLFNTIKYGYYFYDRNYKGNMIGFEEKLLDQEIYQIIDYIYDSWPDEIKSNYNEIHN